MKAKKLLAIILCLTIFFTMGTSSVFAQNGVVTTTDKSADTISLSEENCVNLHPGYYYYKCSVCGFADTANKRTITPPANVNPSFHSNTYLWKAKGDIVLDCDLDLHHVTDGKINDITVDLYAANNKRIATLHPDYKIDIPYTGEGKVTFKESALQELLKVCRAKGYTLDQAKKIVLNLKLGYNVNWEIDGFEYRRNSHVTIPVDFSSVTTPSTAKPPVYVYKPFKITKYRRFVWIDSNAARTAYIQKYSGGTWKRVSYDNYFSAPTGKTERAYYALSTGSYRFVMKPSNPKTVSFRYGTKAYTASYATKKSKAKTMHRKKSYKTNVLTASDAKGKTHYYKFKVPKRRSTKINYSI